MSKQKSLQTHNQGVSEGILWNLQKRVMCQIIHMFHYKLYIVEVFNPLYCLHLITWNFRDMFFREFEWIYFATPKLRDFAEKIKS